MQTKIIYFSIDKHAVGLSSLYNSTRKPSKFINIHD